MIIMLLVSDYTQQMCVAALHRSVVEQEQDLVASSSDFALFEQVSIPHTAWTHQHNLMKWSPNASLRWHWGVKHNSKENISQNTTFSDTIWTTVPLDATTACMYGWWCRNLHRWTFIHKVQTEKFWKDLSEKRSTNTFMLTSFSGLFLPLKSTSIILVSI